MTALPYGKFFAVSKFFCEDQIRQLVKKKNQSCFHYPIPDLTVCSSKDVIYEKLTDFTVESVKLKSISISFSMASKGIAGH